MKASELHNEQASTDFMSMIEANGKLLHKVVNTYCFDRDEQRDLMQDIIAALWHAFPRYDSQRRFSTWMYRIALNVAISRVRSQVRQRRHLAPMPDCVESFADNGPTDPELEQQVGMLHRFIATLDPLNRALLLLYLEACPAREIAEVLGMSESNVTTRIHRLKQRIRDYIEPQGKP